jgi:hypothetical protein
VDLFDDLGAKCSGAPDDGVKISHLEPEENAMSVRSRVCTHEVRVVFFVPGVKLENQSPVAKEPIVDVSVLVLPEVLDAEKLLVKAAAGANVANRYEGLDLHLGLVLRFALQGHLSLAELRPLRSAV